MTVFALSHQNVSQCFHSIGLGVGAMLLNATPVPSAFSEGLFSPSHRAALQASSFCLTKECSIICARFETFRAERRLESHATSGLPKGSEILDVRMSLQICFFSFKSKRLEDPSTFAA